jgi:hypothetical protein
VFEYLTKRFAASAARGREFIEFVGVFLLALLAVFKEFLPDIFQAYIPEPKALLAVCLLLCCVACLGVLDTNMRLRALAGGMPLRRMSLTEGMNHLQSMGARKSLTVYAISSRHIQTMIASCKFSIESARVLLWKPSRPVHGENIFQHYTAEIEHVIQSGWKSAQSRAIVKKTSIRRYEDLPDIFFVLFDKEHALLGFYKRNNDPYNVVDYSEVIIFDGSNQESARTIQWLLQQFESHWTVASDELEIPDTAHRSPASLTR